MSPIETHYIARGAEAPHSQLRIGAQSHSRGSIIPINIEGGYDMDIPHTHLMTLRRPGGGRIRGNTNAHRIGSSELILGEPSVTDNLQYSEQRRPSI